MDKLKETIIQRIEDLFAGAIDGISSILATENEITLKYNVMIKKEGLELSIDTRQTYSKGNVKASHMDRLSYWPGLFDSVKVGMSDQEDPATS
ncbi:MAG: hypothetical protein HQL06_01020 [Nitrospirae bacterium]|nr:hypothetical protein [Nitrospirota bacterium]